MTTRRKILLSVLGALTLAVAVGVATADTDRPTTTPAGQAPTNPEAPADPAAPAPAPAPAARPIGDGTWLVGSDVLVGEYHSGGAEPGPLGFCVWSYTSGPEADARYYDSGTASTDTAQQIVVLDRPGAVFTSNGCQPWALAE